MIKPEGILIIITKQIISTTTIVLEVLWHLCTPSMGSKSLTEMSRYVLTSNDHIV